MYNTIILLKGDIFKQEVHYDEVSEVFNGFAEFFPADLDI